MRRAFRVAGAAAALLLQLAATSGLSVVEASHNHFDPHAVQWHGHADDHPSDGRSAHAQCILCGHGGTSMLAANRAGVITFAGVSVLWAASLAGWLDPLPENVTSAAGSLTIAGAMVRSARVCQADACSVCADEEHADQSLPQSGLRRQGRNRFHRSR